MKLKEAFYLWRNTYFIVLAAKICLADFGEVFRCDIINLKRQESVGHNLEYLSATDAAVNAHGAFLQVKIHEVFPDKFMMLHVKPAHLSVFPQIQRGSELLVTITVAVILRLPPNEDGTNEPRVFYIEVQGKVFFIHPLALCVEYTVDVVVVKIFLVKPTVFRILQHGLEKRHSLIVRHEHAVVLLRVSVYCHVSQTEQFVVSRQHFVCYE